MTHRDAIDELTRYVEDERHAEQQWRQAGLLKKAKWSVFRMPSDESRA